MENPLLPLEPIVALNELRSEEALKHPQDMALTTIVEAFAPLPIVKYLAKPGHEREYMRAFVQLHRQSHQYEVHAADDFRVVALVREVPEVPPALGAEEPGPNAGCAQVDSSRAAASANVEPALMQGAAAPGAVKVESRRPDPDQLREAVQLGSLGGLLSLGVSWAESELLVHTNPDRIEAAEELQRNLQQYLDQYVQEHGPTLHLHFLAVSPQAQRTGRGRDMMQHLVRMADSEGRHLYLEASSEASRKLYLRNGFKDLCEYVLGDAGPTLYIMARPQLATRS